jgi:hypothetical protein
MKYLSNAVNFTIKNWMLIIPLFALLALASLIGSAGSASLLGLVTTFANLDNFTSTEALFKLIPVVFTALIGSGIVSFIAQFIHQPVTYGLVNKGLDTGSASLSDIGAALSGNFVKYLLYFIGSAVVSLVLGIATVLILLIMTLLVSVLKGVGIALMVLVIIALVIFFIAFGVLTSLWFSAMIVDGLDVVGAFKKSIEIVKTCFWTVLGITLLVGIAAGIVSSILGFLGVIPVIGPIILSAVTAIQTFIMIVFSIMIYREKTGRASA